MATQNGTFYRTEISVDRNGRYNGVRIPVTRKEIDDECANGMSIATLSIEQPGGEKAASSNAKATKSEFPAGIVTNKFHDTHVNDYRM